MAPPRPLNRPPPGAWLAAACGSAPFVGTAAGLWLIDGPWRGYLFLSGLNYALASLAFLCALHLGLALAASARGVRRHVLWWLFPFLPPLAGLAALGGLVDYSSLVAVFVAAFLASHVADVRAVRDGLAPPWYGPVRKCVTAGVLVWGGTFLVHAPVNGA